MAVMLSTQHDVSAVQAVLPHATRSQIESELQRAGGDVDACVASLLEGPSEQQHPSGTANRAQPDRNSANYASPRVRPIRCIADYTWTRVTPVVLLPCCTGVCLALVLFGASFGAVCQQFAQSTK